MAMCLWRSMIFRDPLLFPRTDRRAVIEVLWGVLSLRWAEAEWEMLSVAGLFDPLRADCLRCQWSTIGHCVWSPWSRRSFCVCVWGGPHGSQRGHRALHPSGTAAGGGDFHAGNYAAQTRFLWLFYYTHFFRDHHFAGNWSDVFTARQSSLCSLFVKYCTAALPTDSSQLYFGGISSLSSPPSPQRRGKGGLRDSSGTSWISALSSLSPPDPLPLLPPWLDSSARGGETWIRFTLNGPLMRSKYSERMLKWGDGESSSFFLIGPPFIESLSGLIALTVWSGIDFWHCNTTIQKTAICSLIKPRWEMLIYRELERTVTVIMTQSVDNLFIKLSYLVSETLQVPRALGYIFKLPPAVQLWENWLIQDAANSSLINGFKCNNSSYWDTGLFTL